MKNELTKETERLITYDFVTAPLSSLYQKAKKIRKGIAVNVYKGLLDEGYIPEEARVTAAIEEESKLKARGMKQGINKFKKAHPRYGKILEGMVEEEREKREVYVMFGLKKGQTLPQSRYIKVMRDLGLGYETAHKLYFDITDMVEKLETKKKEGLQSILVG